MPARGHHYRVLAVGPEEAKRAATMAYAAFHGAPRANVSTEVLEAADQVSDLDSGDLALVSRVREPVMLR